MKFLKLFFLTTLTWLSTISWAQSAYYNEMDKQVTYAPQPVLDAQVVGVEADYPLLLLSLDYPSQSLQTQYKKWQDLYPQYEIRQHRSVALKDGRVRIPLLGVDQTVRLMPGQLGPYFSISVKLTDKQLKLLKQYPRLQDLVQIEMLVQMEVTTTQEIESLSLESNACQTAGIQKNLNEVLSWIQNKTRGFKARPTTLADLSKNLMSQCFQLDGEQTVNSVLELVKLKLKTIANDQPIVGRTAVRQLVYKEFELPFIK